MELTATVFCRSVRHAMISATTSNARDHWPNFVGELVNA